MSDRKPRVLVPLGAGFEELEAIASIDVLRRAGCQVVTVSVGAPNPIVGRNRIRVLADIDLADALAEWGDDWDLVLLPGGLGGVEAIEGDADLMGLIGRRVAAGQLTAAICAAPRVLKAVGLDTDTPVTGHPGCRGDLDGFSAYREDAVVVSGSVITSRGPGTAIDFGLECVSALLGPEVAARIAAEIVHR